MFNSTEGVLRMGRKDVVFKKNEIVVWESQSQGSWKMKTGIVKECVPAGIDAKDVLMSLPGDPYSVLWDLRSGPRNHDSYLVEVRPFAYSKARPKLYWPRVSSLKKVESPKNRGGNARG